MSVVIGPISRNYNNMNVSIRQRVDSPIVQKISNELKARGRVAVAEKVFEEALRHVSKLLAEKNIQISTIVDNQNGSQVRIVEGDSGKLITQLPPDGVIEIAQKSKEQRIGWIMDVLL